MEETKPAHWVRVILMKTLANFFQSKFTDDIARVLQYNKSDVMPYPRKKACGAIQLIFLKVRNYTPATRIDLSYFILFPFSCTSAV